MFSCECIVPGGFRKMHIFDGTRTSFPPRYLNTTDYPVERRTVNDDKVVRLPWNRNKTYLIIPYACFKHQICHNNSSEVHVLVWVYHLFFAIGDTRQIKKLTAPFGNTQFRIRLYNYDSSR